MRVNKPALTGFNYILYESYTGNLKGKRINTATSETDIKHMFDGKVLFLTLNTQEFTAETPRKYGQV